MRKILFLIILLLSVNFSVFAQTAVSYQQQSWELGNNLSRAALLNATTDDAALTERTFALAKTNAKNLKIVLPELPARTGDKIKDNAAALYYLLNTTGMPIIKIQSEKNLGAKQSALFELAFKTNILLLFPNGKEAQAIVDVINKRFETAGLTAYTFAELTRLVTGGATYEQIKKEIFDLQKLVPMFVAVSEFSKNGEILYAAEDYAGSAAQFSSALEILPDEPKFFFLRARTYMQGSKYAEAIADYTKVIRFAQSVEGKKDLPTAYHNRGLCYALTKRYALALTDLNVAIKLNPQYASAYKMRSMVYKQTGNLKLATADYQKAESLQPGIMN